MLRNPGMKSQRFEERLVCVHDDTSAVVLECGWLEKQTRYRHQIQMVDESLGCLAPGPILFCLPGDGEQDTVLEGERDDLEERGRRQVGPGETSSFAVKNATKNIQGLCIVVEQPDPLWSFFGSCLLSLIDYPLKLFGA